MALRDARFPEHVTRGYPDQVRSPSSAHETITAIVFDEVPLDELARHWSSNRNALYKLLHDARRKLRAHLVSRGLDIQEMLDVFGRADRTNR